jgi:hypothetical protein
MSALDLGRRGARAASRRLGLPAALLASGALFAACGGGGDGGTGPTTPTFPSPLAGEYRSVVGVAVPPGFPLQAFQMTLFAGTQSAQMQSNGQGLANLPTGIPVLVGAGASGSPSMLGVNTGSATQQISATSTAAALAFLSPALATTSNAQATPILSAINGSPALGALTTAVQNRLVTSPGQAITVADPGVATALGNLVSNVLSTITSPRFQQPLRPLPTVETPTDRGGVQLTVLPNRDGQGRLQVSLNNGQPRWVSVVRSYSNDGVTWTTPTAENGTFGVMLGAGTQGGASIQPNTATIPLSPSPYVRITTYGLGNDLATALDDPNARFIQAAQVAQWIATAAIPAVGPVLTTGALANNLTWGTGDTGTLQSWAQAALPCAQDPAVVTALRQSTQSGSFDAAFRPLYSCIMRAGATAPGVLTGLLTAAGQAGRTVPPEVTGMFNVLSNLGSGVEGAFNTPAIRALRAVNSFTVVDSTLIVSVTGVTEPFGPVAGGARVSVAGSGFTAGSTVSFGGRAGTSVQVVSTSRIDVTVPAGAAIGAVDVVVTTSGGGTGTCPNCFIYFTPTIAVTPSSGPVTGGTSVTVTDIPAASLIQRVDVGGRAATGLSVQSPTSVRFTTPSGTAQGAVPVNFVYPVGTLGCPNCFTYTAAPSGNGRFAGIVRNAVTNNPIAGASVSIRNAGTATQVDLVTTGADGSYLSNPLPAGRYDLHHSAAGFNNSPLFDRELIGGAGTPTTTLPTVQMVPTGTANGTLNGVVRDATTNAVISGATVELRAGGYNTSGAPIATATSSGTGTYSFPNLPAGTYTVRGTRAGYTEGSVVAAVSQATQTAPVLFLSPTGTGFTWRIVLSWGAEPRDLDSYLSGPQAGSGSRFVVAYYQRGSLTANPFAQLDVDVTTGFGPETITIAQQIAGTYRYFVNRFSGTGSISTSGARVDLYRGNNLVRQFYPVQGTGDWWTVFELSGETITTINSIGSSMPAEPVPGHGPLRVRTIADEIRDMEGSMVPKVGGDFRR